MTEHCSCLVHVASVAAIFTLLLRRRVAFLHLTATCRPLFKPSVSLLPTYKSTQITFTTSCIVCLQTTIYNTPIPIKSEVTCRGLHLDQQLTLQAHIKAKRQQLNLRVKKYYWLIDQTYQLSVENKLLLYKTVPKPIWTNGIELWGCSKQSNTKIFSSLPIKNIETDHKRPAVCQQPNIAY